MLIPQPPQGSFQPSPATAEDSSETENFTRFPLLSHTFIFQLYQQLRGLAENRCFGFWFGGIFFFSGGGVVLVCFQIIESWA